MLFAKSDALVIALVVGVAAGAYGAGALALAAFFETPLALNTALTLLLLLGLLLPCAFSLVGVVAPGGGARGLFALGYDDM